MPCQDCLYWTKWENDSERGDCCKHSPVIVSEENGDYSSCWPDTHWDQYCGDLEIVAVLDTDSGLNKEDAKFIITACNKHDKLKAKAELLPEIVNYFEDNCEDCEVESIKEYGRHGKEGCKSCLSGRLLRQAKELK